MRTAGQTSACSWSPQRNVPPRQGARSRGSGNWGDRSKSRQVGVKKATEMEERSDLGAPTPKSRNNGRAPPPTVAGIWGGVAPGRRSPRLGVAGARIPPPQALGYPTKPGPWARAADEGLPVGAGRGGGQPRGRGRDSPWREARRDRSAGRDARPVSGAPRAARLSRWGRGEAGGAWAGVGPGLSPPLPASSCPPTAPRAPTPCSPRGCGGPPSRPQWQHYRKLLILQERAWIFQDIPTLGRAFPLGLVLESERASEEIKESSGSAGGARWPRARSRNYFLDDTAGRGAWSPRRPERLRGLRPGLGAARGDAAFGASRGAPRGGEGARRGAGRLPGRYKPFVQRDFLL